MNKKISNKIIKKPTTGKKKLTPVVTKLEKVAVSKEALENLSNVVAPLIDNTEVVDNGLLPIEQTEIKYRKQLQQHHHEISVKLAGIKVGSEQITGTQWMVLRAIQLRGKTNPMQISFDTRMLGPSVSRILNKLTKSNLIAQKASPADRRCKIIAISSVGSRIVNRGLAALGSV